MTTNQLVKSDDNQYVDAINALPVATLFEDGKFSRGKALKACYVQIENAFSIEKLSDEDKQLIQQTLDNRLRQIAAVSVAHESMTVTRISQGIKFLPGEGMRPTQTVSSLDRREYSIGKQLGWALAHYKKTLDKAGTPDESERRIRPIRNEAIALAQSLMVAHTNKDGTVDYAAILRDTENKVVIGKSEFHVLDLFKSYLGSRSNVCQNWQTADERKAEREAKAKQLPPVQSSVPVEIALGSSLVLENRHEAPLMNERVKLEPNEPETTVKATPRTRKVKAA